MALLRVFEDHEYWPEYGTFLIRDHVPHGTVRMRVDPLLEEHAVDTQPCGSVARAGDGWLDGKATDRHHTVRLELHDAPPEPDRDDWADIVETPMASGGTVGLAMVTGGPGRDPFRLGQPGLYRVRFARRRAGEGDLYRLQFWPVDAPPDPPRWIKRSTSLVEGGDDGWRSAFGWSAMELLGVVRAAADGGGEGEGEGGASIEDIAAWVVAHHRHAGWLHEPSPDDLTELAGQLGVPAPVTRADLLPLLAAAGLLETDGDPPRYRVTTPPRPAWEVLGLPAQRVAAMRNSDARSRYCYAASDLVSLVLWAREAETPVTVGWLADRLAASPAVVRQIIEYAVPAGLFEPADLPDDPDAELRLVVRSREPQRAAPQPVPKPATMPAPRPAKSAGRTARLGREHLEVRQRRHSARLAFVTADRDATPPPPPAGAPPRAGVVGGGGHLVVWRDGAPFVLAHWPGVQVDQAFQSRHGTVLIGAGQTALVREDGDLKLLATKTHWRAAIDPAGDLLAVVESHVGRRSWARLHLIDLASGDRQIMPSPEEPEFLAVLGAYGGAVYLRGGQPSERTWRWRPGTAPEPMPYRIRHVDPYTGVMLAEDSEPAPLLVHPDGTTRRVAADRRAMLAPGAAYLYDWKYEPPALTLVPVDAPDRPTTIALPGGSETATSIPFGPAWEDPGHVLVPARHGRNALGVPAVRVDVRTGAVESVPLPTEAGHRPLFVTPLPSS